MIERQKRFTAHYAETGNGAEAARRAGYSEAAASDCIKRGRKLIK